MIVVATRNRHNGYAHLLQLLCGPRATRKNTITYVSPVTVNVARPDEVVDLLPGLTVTPEAAMHDMLTAAGALRRGLPSIEERVIECDRMILSPFTCVQFGLGDYGATLNATASVQTCDLRGSAGGSRGSVYATVGFLQQMLAESLGKGLGGASFVINNIWAVNEDLKESRGFLTMPEKTHSVYAVSTMRPTPILTAVDLRTFSEDCRLYLYDKMTIGLRSQWLRRVALPVINACRHVDQTGEIPAALEIAAQCEAPDWKLVTQSYIEGHALRGKTEVE